MTIATRNLVAVAAAISLAGCFGKCDKNAQPAPNEGDVAQPAEMNEGEMPYEEDPLYKLFQKAEDLFMAGSTNETTALLAEAFDSEEYAAYRAQILPPLVRILLENGDVEAAKARVIAAFTSGDSSLSDGVLGAVFFHFTNAGDQAAALAWTDEILALEAIAPNIRRTFTEWNINAAIEAGDDARVIAAAEKLIAMAPEGDAAEILRRALESLITRGKNDLLADIISRAGKSVTSDEATRNLVSVMRLRILAIQGKWDDLAAAFASTTTLPDKELNYALRSTIPLALKAERFATIDAICGKIATDPNSGRMAAGYSARQWVSSAAKTDVAKVPERIEALLGGATQQQEISSIFVNHAYDNIDDPSFATPMRSIAERLLAASPDNSRSSIRTVLLDFSFILEDYDTALNLLNEGFSGYDENWHTMAISKVSAHKALKEGRKLDAIRDFRKFMSVIQVSQEDTSDPTTGVVHSREMILGRNAARIGDIYASIPDPEKAAEAYKEARDYYATALEKAQEAGSIELIKKELAAIPAQ